MDVQPSKSNSSTAQKKIVWVEDDRLIATILSDKLIACGFELFRFTTGAEALKFLQTNKPDALIVDLILPDMNGFQILEKIAADPNLKNLPRMVLSNLDNVADREKSKKLGVDKFLVKAVTPLDKIVDEINRLF